MEAVVAGAALQVSFQVVIDRVAIPAIKKILSVYGLDDDVDQLKIHYRYIEQLLKDLEEDRRLYSRTMTTWLRDLENAANRVDTVLDELVDNMGFIKKWKMELKVKKAIRNFERMARMRRDYVVSHGDDNHRGGVNIGETDHTNILHVWGRNDDKERLIEQLTHNPNENEEDVSIIVIVGMGGIGKTTLAKLVFNHIRGLKCFEKTMWACLSQNLDKARTIKAIISSANAQNCDMVHMDALVSCLEEILINNMYLLVLDDVWIEDPLKWIELETLFKHGKRGSKVIVTTRSEIVASNMRGATIYYLKELYEYDCQSLFIHWAFPARDELSYPNLLDIANDIVKRCKGVPLVAEALGVFLKDNRDYDDWLLVKEADIWKLDKEQRILSKLRPSYYNLPSNLRRCFELCSLFPKGYEFRKDVLVKLWVAENLIERKERKLPEDVAEEYFDELQKRVTFRSSDRDFVYHDLGVKIPCFKMHDLIHELAYVVVASEFSQMVVGEELNITEETHHLSILSHFQTQLNPSCLQQAKKLETLMLLSNEWSQSIKVPNEIFKLAFLRVLDLSNANIMKLSKSICKLRQLRYLDLSNTRIMALPKGFSSLQNLQTLRLLNCKHLLQLPSKLQKMTSLRHLEFDWYGKISSMPSSIGKLTSLQTLSLFIVGKDCGHGITELQGLSLRGALTLKNLENVFNQTEAEKAGLRQKNKLSSLRFSWKEVDEKNVGMNENHEQVIEGLQPHQNTRGLGIENYMGGRFPSWLMDMKLSGLVEVVLINCKNCIDLPPLHQLSSLDTLRIEGMPELRRWSSGNASPILLYVTKLEIKGCPNLTLLPQLPSLKKLQLLECNEHILSSVDSALICYLKIGGFAKMVTFPEAFFHNKAHLRLLEISDCPTLSSLSEDLYHCTAIDHMVIKNCDQVATLMKGWHNLTSLYFLRIEECHHLNSLPREELSGLTSLQSLHIYSCKNLSDLGDGLQCLLNLQDLCIADCCSLVALPERMENLRMLKTVALKGLPLLNSLQELCNLTSLEELNLETCYNIRTLPTSLQDKSKIIDCPGLEHGASEREIGWLRNLLSWFASL